MLEMKRSANVARQSYHRHSLDAMICSFECTFCRDCTDGALQGRCPNCGGELIRRPVRAIQLRRERGALHSDSVEMN